MYKKSGDQKWGPERGWSYLSFADCWGGSIELTDFTDNRKHRA